MFKPRIRPEIFDDWKDVKKITRHYDEGTLLSRRIENLFVGNIIEPYSCSQYLLIIGRASIMI